MTENAQNADFAENRRFSQIHPFSWKFKRLEGAGNRRKPKILAENRRKPQIGLCHLRCVTFGSALITVTDFIFSEFITVTVSVTDPDSNF